MQAAPHRLVGRAEELGDLGEALRGAGRGGPTALVLSGEPGVGKSRLLAEFLRQAREQGATVLRGGCLDIGGGTLPYLPMIEMLRGLVRDRGAAAVRALVDPGWVELARVHLALAKGSGFEPRPADGASAQLLEAFLQLCSACAQAAPTVVAVEDLHWLDRSTGDLLAYLVRALDEEQVLVVATCRPEPEPPVRAMLTDLMLGGRCRRRELMPLRDDEIAELVRDLMAGAPDEAVVRSVVERSDGNAFFARELAAAGDREPGAVPVAVRDLLQVRLEAGSAQTRHVARVAAAAGRPVGHPLLAAASGLPPDELLPAVRACVTAGLIVVEPNQEYRFRHALARDAVYTDLLPGERAEHHRALATALAAAPDLAMDEPASATAELAHHWCMAGDAVRAFTASVAAAEAAEAAYGYPEAERQYERALRLWPAVDRAVDRDLIDLSTAAADASRWAGHVDRAVAIVERALELAAPSGPRTRVGTLHERRGRYLWELGRVEESLRAYERAGAEFAEEPPSATKAWVLAGYATALSMAGRLHDALRQCDEALEVAESAGATVEAGRAMNTRGTVLAVLGRPEEGIPALRESIRIAEAGGTIEDVLRGWANLGYALEVACRYEESVAATLQGVRHSRDLGLGATGGAVLLANAASVLTMLGRWDDAEEIAEAARARGAPVGFDRYRQIVLAELDVGRGRFEVAEARLHSIGEDALNEPQLAALAYAARAEAELWQARPRSALELVLRGLDVVATGDDPGQILSLAALGLRAVADAAELPVPPVDLEQATAVLSVRVDAAGAVELLPAPAAFAQLCRAEQRRSQRGDEAADWAAVAQRWEALPQPYPAAYARWRQGVAALHRRDRAQAAAALETARRSAAGLGADPLLREIDFLVRAARLPLERPDHGAQPASASPYGLTRRELEVLALMAEGLTNRQVARQLFITEKTAGVHVSNVLAKLVVANRGQAAALARRAGIVPGP